jgi:outer membrane protein OmpA-like peptidoglycan-associated protein
MHVVVAVLVLVGAFAPRARAQVALEQFKPAPLASDGFAVSRPDVLRHLEWGVLALVDYANDPLVLKQTRPERELSVVEHHLVLHVGAALGLGKRLTIFGTLPVHLLMDGDTPPAGYAAADGTGLGDVAFGGRFRLAGGPDALGTLTAELIVRLPTADLANGSQVYSGDEIGSYEPVLIGELHFGRFDVRVRPGVRLRKERQVGDLELGHELVYGLGARYRIVQNLYAHAELYGSANFASFGDKETTPLELLLGAKYQAADWFFGGAAGPGLLAGYGSPDVRVIGMLGYAPIATPKPVLRDSDGDGLLDPDDRCVLEPEDKDEFEDGDGCPELDDDKDGIPDARDTCRLEPEDTDAFEDDDGCPDLDNDKDTILDASDTCPLDPEDRDGFEDENGCPDVDNDKDGVLDVSDKCPLEPGVPEQQGCPMVKIDIEKGQLMILDRVEFGTNKDVILEQSLPLMNDVQKTIADNPQLKRLRIEGHTDDVGRDKKNLELSKRRARSVARWLVEHGITAERLEAWGCGESRPLRPNDDDTARQQNRRVEFHVVDPAPPEPRGMQGCVEIPLK